MSSVKVELNLRGINEMMMSPEIQAALTEAGEAVARNAGSQAGGAEYGVDTHLADYVAITNVYPADKKAASANYADNTLLKAVGAVGLPTRKPRL